MSDKVKIVEVTTPTCGICKSIAPMIKAAVAKVADKVDFEVVEASWDDAIVKEHNINQVPTFLFFNPETNELVNRHSGAIMMPGFIQLVEDSIAKI